MQIFKREKAQDLSGDKTGPAAGQRRTRLLVVDEDPIALSVMARRLSHRGHDVVLAENGIVALSLMQAQRFDLIIIDMMMAMLSGIDTMKKMKASGLLGNAAIMMISGRSDSHAAVEALAEGADEHIVKPFDFDVLDARIRHLVHRAEQMSLLIRHNDQLDARIARRAVELGETRAELEELHADRARLVASIQSLHDELQRVSAAMQH
ncbi:response regulator transcription factor [Rhizorhapis sp. SPR117]|uniref:response regulator transcription factor n=1 Tax=Rhizorhapis sp. SPR117 TaxID=2912611 RepID=UPI001F297046|nr:response regulator [Rhizorhapis sp. SPR117]